MTATTGTKRKRMWAVIKADGSLCMPNNYAELTPFPSRAKSLRRIYRMLGADAVVPVTVTWTLPKPTPKKARKT